MNALSPAGAHGEPRNQNMSYHTLCEFLIINKYETLKNLKDYDIGDFLYLVEIAAVTELGKLRSLSKMKQ